MRITLQSHRHSITTHARAGSAAWLNFFARSEWVHERTPLSACFGLNVERSVDLARHTLMSQALKTLAAGDIILPDSPCFGCDGEGSIVLGHLRLRVRYQVPGRLEIIAVESKLNSKKLDENFKKEPFDEAADDDYPEEDDEGMENDEFDGEGEEDDSDQEDEDDLDEQDEDDSNSDGKHNSAASARILSPASATAASYDDIDMVPVTLSFELGKVSMGLGELRTLGEGAVLLLKGGSPASIAIVASGKILGRGEAVEIDGSLGIRITQWGVT